jgi:hypothetical protein
VLMGNLADDPVGQIYTASLTQGLRARLARGRKFAN